MYIYIYIYISAHIYIEYIHNKQTQSEYITKYVCTNSQTCHSAGFVMPSASTSMKVKRASVKALRSCVCERERVCVCV